MDEDDGSRDISHQIHDLQLLLLAISQGLMSGQNFDLLQGLLALTLQLHGPAIRRHKCLQAPAAEVQAMLKRVWSQRLDPLLQGTRCMLSFLSGSAF